MKPEEQITRSEDTDDTGFWKHDGEHLEMPKL